MTDHLTPEQIDQYVARRGTADSIIALAEHLRDCPDCRDRVAESADPDITLGRRSRRQIWDEADPNRRSGALNVLFWIIALVLVGAIIIAVLIAR